MTADRVKAVLAAAGLPVTLRTLEDSLWLACHLPAGAPVVGDVTNGEEDTLASTAGVSAPELRHEPGKEPVPTETPSAAGGALYVTEPGSGAGPTMRPVQAPAAPMLGHPLDLQRAVRPLKKRVIADGRDLLDEEATAARIADSDRWDPVLTGEPERWLDLVLVVDMVPSMWLWQPLVRELHTALSQTGAFRDVQVAYMSGGEITDAKGGRKRAPVTLVDPTGRRAVLVFSDCSGGHWWQGKALAAVRTWARNGPTAILQPLPEHMWRRTAAPAITGWARSTRSGAADSALAFTADLTDGPLDRGVVPVPVLELAPSWLNDWAKLVAGPEYGSRRAAVTCVPPSPAAAQSPRVELETALSVKERVVRFQVSASPEAVRLAAYIAVSVPALPVMRLIQRRMFRDPHPSHLAEVLLSGLLRPVGRGLYEFIDENARLALLTTLPRSDSWYAIRVLREVSAEIERTAATAATTTFPAWLEELRGTVPNPDGTPFALVSPAAVAALGNLTVQLRPKAASQSAPPRLRSAGKRRDPDLEPMFYLSYRKSLYRRLHDDSDPDRWVKKFYHDLSSDVHQLTSAATPGYMDINLNVGSIWSDETAWALGACRVFVPVITPGYFESEWCGKEWGAFELRASSHAPRGANAVLPVLWTPYKRYVLPDIVERIQLISPNMPATYEKEGIYGLMKLRRYQAAYKKTVFQLAKRITDVAQAEPLEPGPPIEWVSAPNVFGPHPDEVEQNRITLDHTESAGREARDVGDR